MKEEKSDMDWGGAAGSTVRNELENRKTVSSL